MVKPKGRAAAAPRREAEAALKLERDGRHEQAIARVDDLAARHPGSALVLHLAGFVHHAAAMRAVHAMDKTATAHHIVTAHGYLADAKRLVPDCVAISDLLARVLFLGLRFEEAEAEARAAVTIAAPVDPADNSVVHARPNTTRAQRAEQCRRSARESLSAIEGRLPRLLGEVLGLDTSGRDGVLKAHKKAKELAKNYPSRPRAQLLSAHMELQCVRVLDPAMDRRPLLERIRVAMNQAIAGSFSTSLLFAMFNAKLCFVLGMYDDVHFEFARAHAISDPVDPKLEDIPPHSVQGATFRQRVRSVNQELERLIDKLFFVANDFWRSMTREKQEALLLVGLVELQEYYHQKYENYQWGVAVAQTISDALSFVSENRSWRFWICPFCAAEKLPNTDSLLEHMDSKHLPKLRSAFDSVLCHYLIEDPYLDDLTLCQDSEGNHFLRFNKTDSAFAYMSVPSEKLPIAVIQQELGERGKEILEDIKVKLKHLPADKLSAEFDRTSHEIQGLWHEFVKASLLDYRLIIKAFAKPFIWTKLLQSLREDKAATKISNADIDVIFPNVVDVCSELHAEDNVGRLEIHPNSSLTDSQSGETGLKNQHSSANESSASNLLGSSSHYSEETSSISIYLKSIEILDKDTDGISILNFIIQVLWNWRGFRNEFLKRRPVCTLPSHEGPCISQMLYNIFSGWQKNDHHVTDSLISLRDTICEVLNDSTVFENVNVNTSSYVVTTILNALRMPEVFLEKNSPVKRENFETLRQPANPAKVFCNKEIICEGVGIKESTTCGDILYADSLEISEVKSFADDKVRQGDPLSVSKPKFSTLAFHIILGEGEVINLLINRLMNDPDVVLLRYQDTTPDILMCTLASMVCA